MKLPKMSPVVARYAVQISIALAVIVLVWIIYRRFRKTDERKDTLDADIKTDKLTHLESYYFVLADKIQTAAEGFGTDEELIYSVMQQMKTDSDVLQLIKAFGKRSFLNGFGVAWKATLTEVLNYELSAKKLARVNEILAENGVSMKF